MMRGDAPAAFATDERLVTLGREHGFALYRAAGGVYRGWARTLLGAPQEGLAELREATVAYRSVAGVMLCPFLVAQADTELHQGHIDQAEVTLADTLDVATKASQFGSAVSCGPRVIWR
jgi:predicted ATPase